MPAYRHTGRVGNAPQGLVHLGPLIQVTLGPHPQDVKAGIVSGARVVAKLMIDTGAQTTVLEDRVAQEIGLVPVRYTLMVGVSQKPENCPVYRAGVTIVMGTNDGRKADLTFATDIVGMPSPHKPAEHVGLLGRDFLAQFRLSYDGRRGEFIVEADLPGRIPGAPPLTRAQRRRDARETS